MAALVKQTVGSSGGSSLTNQQINFTSTGGNLLVLLYARRIYRSGKDGMDEARFISALTVDRSISGRFGFPRKRSITEMRL